MITDEKIIENSKDLPVPDFNKKEVEAIAKAACPRGIDVDNLPECVELADIDFDDDIGEQLENALNKGQLPNALPETTPLTKEQYDKIRKIVKTAIKAGVICYSSTYLFINYFVISQSDVHVCFGCISSNANFGAHYDLDLIDNLDETYSVESHYFEI